MDVRIALLVPTNYVKRVKLALEEQGKLDRKTKITAERLNSNEFCSTSRMQILTTITPDQDELTDEFASGHKDDILKQLQLEDLHKEVGITYVQGIESSGYGLNSHNPLSRAVREGLLILEKIGIFNDLEISIMDLTESFPTTYSVYKPLLLLPPNAFTSSTWSKLLSSYRADSPTLAPLWKGLASAVGTTHIAINAGIPLSTTPNTQGDTSNENKENILRSPLNITPIYGDFGPRPTAQTLSNPTASDFTSAFWVSTCQNGIHQVWAPTSSEFFDVPQTAW